MPNTEAWELQCYGCKASRLEALVNEYVTRFSPRGGMSEAEHERAEAAMLAISMLSDSQEEIERGMDNSARQSINRAKWIIGHRLSGRPR